MKKITFLVAFILLAVTSSFAQVSVNEGFEASTTPTGWTYVSFSRSTTSPCVGTASLRRNFWSSGLAGSVTTPNYAAASNGQQINVSFDWKTIEYSSGSGVGINMDIQYSTDNGGTWNTFGNVSSTAITTCATWTGSIAAGVVPAGSDFKLRFNGTRTAGDFYFYIDKVAIAQQTVVPPSCASSLLPADVATNVERNVTMSWATVAGADNYDVYFGTTATPPLVTNTASTSYSGGVLAASTTYYWQIVPKNANGPAVGCSIQSFTTGTNLLYCLPTTTYGCTDGDVVARVTLNTLDNDSGTGCPSGTAGYSDYTGDTALTTTLQAGNSYNCTVYAGQYAQGYAAWIDYNDDGVFDNSTERIGYSSGTVAGSGSSGVLGSSATFPIVLACNPPIGQHRLRVRGMFNTSGNLVTPCTNNSYGEVEDYLITISAPAACPQPTTLGATAITQNTATLTWNAGCAETSWDVHITDAGAGAPTGTASNPGVTSTTLNVTGLTVDHAYEFYVRANCGGNGDSLWTGPFAFSTLPAAPNCASLLTPADSATGVTLNPANNSVDLTWDAPTSGATPTSYNLYTGNSAATLTLQGNYTTLTATLSNLNYATTYYWKAVPVGTGGEATGCTLFSFTTEAAPAAPANDNCSGATVLTPALDYPTAAITATLIGATNSEVADPTIPAPGCASYAGHDVWFSVVVPASGSITFETGDSPSSAITDTGMAIYSGTCGALTLVQCDDDSSANGAFSLVSLTGRTPGEVLYARVWRYNSVFYGKNTNGVGEFGIAAYDASLPSTSFNFEGFKAYPNPVKDIFNITYNKEISSVSVLNLLGQEMLSKKVNALNTSLDLSNLSRGTYLLKVQVDDQIGTIKLVKE